MVLELARGLSPRVRTALADLERRTLRADGGRLKLEWGALNARTGEFVEDFLWWEGDRLIGFLGMYGFSGSLTVELAGMVDPAIRRRGIGRALLEAALPICAERGYATALLVTPRSSVAGRIFAIGRGAVLEHSEHALTLTGPPAARPPDPAITMRTATAADAPAISRLLASAFGWSPPDVADRLTSPTARTVVVERSGSVVGTLRVTHEGETVGVYGFAVDPAWQGRGIGRDVLRRVCRELFHEGVDRIGLEVEVDNEHALGLYTLIGFTLVTTEDYYALPIGPVAESTSWR